MTGVDVSKMKKHHKSQQKSGDFYQFMEGETQVYLCPPCREGDKWKPTTGLNYIPVVMHYQLGPKKGSTASLDTEQNPILEHPFVIEQLKKSGKYKKIKGVSCPVAAAFSAGKIDDPDESRAQTRYLWNVIPLKHRASKDEEWRDLPPKVVPVMISKTLYDGFMEPYYDNGDVSDPDGAILVRVGRKGVKKSTKYICKVEPSTMKKPFVLSSKLKSLMAAAFKEQGDLFRIAASLFRTPEDIKAMLKGLDTTSDPDEDEDEEDDEAEIDEDEKPKKKSKKSDDDEDEEESDEDEDEDEEESEDDEDEDEKPKKKSKKSDDEEEDEDEDEKPKKKAKKPSDDDEDEDEDEEEDDEDEDEKPKKKAKKSKPADDDDEDDDEDEKPKKKSKKSDDDDEEDDDEDEKPKKKAKKKASDDDEDSDEEEDVGLAELQEELDRIGKGDKKGKKSKKDDEDDEEDDDEEDDDEDEKPKKKAKKKASEDEDDDD